MYLFSSLCIETTTGDDRGLPCPLMLVSPLVTVGSLVPQSSIINVVAESPPF